MFWLSSNLKIKNKRNSKISKIASLLFIRCLWLQLEMYFLVRFQNRNSKIFALSPSIWFWTFWISSLSDLKLLNWAWIRSLGLRLVNPTWNGRIEKLGLCSRSKISSSKSIGRVLILLVKLDWGLIWSLGSFVTEFELVLGQICGVDSKKKKT